MHDPTQSPDDDPLHEPVGNEIVELDGLEAAPGEGPDQSFAVGELAAFGLETLPGWTRAKLFPDPPRPESGGGPARVLTIDSLRARPVPDLGPDSSLEQTEGGYTPESIVGRDDRVRLRETHRYPWRAICELRIHTKIGEVFSGTGWFAGPRTVITAGHCLHLAQMGGWATAIEVIPGRDGDDRPYSSVRSSTLRSVRGWTVDKQRHHDYGAIILPSDQALPEVGTFALGVYPSLVLHGAHLNLAGYPADKPEGTAWWMARRAKSIERDVIRYDIDTAIGQSGAPVWFLDAQCRRRVVGIHTNGSQQGNSATRITPHVLANIRRWISEGS